jgi:hypothetical protein
MKVRTMPYLSGNEAAELAEQAVRERVRRLQQRRRQLLHPEQQAAVQYDAPCGLPLAEQLAFAHSTA